jgi:hypothetical protein
MMYECSICKTKIQGLYLLGRHEVEQHGDIQRLRAWILFLGSQAPELKHYCYDALHTTQKPPEVANVS